jgi:hypothetical protein
MADSMTLLEEALEVGREELEHLINGRDEEAQSAAHRRGELMDRAWRNRQGADFEALVLKLKELQSQQGRLTSEAKKLHETLRQDLAKAKQENRRLTAYHGSLRPPAVSSRFLNKRS